MWLLCISSGRVRKFHIIEIILHSIITIPEPLKNTTIWSTHNQVDQIAVFFQAVLIEPHQTGRYSPRFQWLCFIHVYSRSHTDYNSKIILHTKRHEDSSLQKRNILFIFVLNSVTQTILLTGTMVSHTNTLLTTHG